MFIYNKHKEIKMHHHIINSEMQGCINACSYCHQICIRMAMNHCLELGGKHTAPEHLKLMINCAEICQTCVNFMLSNSPFHHIICQACAKICKACANDCEQIGDMDECIKACQQCAQKCENMESLEA